MREACRTVERNVRIVPDFEGEGIHPFRAPFNIGVGHILSGLRHAGRCGGEFRNEYKKDHPKPKNSIKAKERK